MKTCIYSKAEFETADGEHILQNFLGARWVSHDISCNEVQRKFGETIDSALEEGLRQFRNLLGTKGGRGGDGPVVKNVEDSAGNRYHLQPGGAPCLAEPVIATRGLPDGSRVAHARLGEMKQLGWTLAKLRSQFPNEKWDMDQIRDKLTAEKEYLNDRLHLQAGIGGRNYFRGLLKAAFNLLGANATDIALRPCFDTLRTYVLDGIGDDANHIRWLATADRLAIANLGPFDHFLAIYSRGNAVDGLIQFFGGIGHMVRLSGNYDGPPFCFGYQVNPLRNSDPPEMRAPAFVPDNLPKFDDGYELPGPAVWPIYRALFSRFLEDYHDHAIEGELSRIVDEVLIPYQGKIPPKEVVGALAERVANFIASRMRMD